MTLFEQTYCDVALPGPLDGAFTYAVGSAMPVAGGRVLVPFGKGSERKLTGIVTRIHNEPPAAGIKVKHVAQVIDTVPVLDEHLLALGRWIAQYYLAPLGEVYRTMLPLQAEVRRAFGCMEGPAEVKPQDWAKEIARLHPSRAKWPRLSIWQGDADKTVACVNAVEIASQWGGLHGAALPAFTACDQTHRNPPPFDPVWTATRGEAETVVELRLLPGFGHAAPVAPAAGCGREGAYVANAGICAASEIAGFFGL